MTMISEFMLMLFMMSMLIGMTILAWEMNRWTGRIEKMERFSELVEELNRLADILRQNVEEAGEITQTGVQDD